MKLKEWYLLFYERIYEVICVDNYLYVFFYLMLDIVLYLSNVEGGLGVYL